MRIALCDDDESALNILKLHIYSFYTRAILAVQIDCFYSGEEYLSTNGLYDIVFMDIYLPGISGTDVIRETGKGKSHQVVFTTTSREHAVEAFALNAAHYLVKPLTEENIAEALSRCLKRMNAFPTKILEIKTAGGVVPISMSCIIFVEVFNKVSIIHTAKNDIQTYSSLDAIFELLDDNCFLKVQRSFVVNMHYIESFFSDRVVLQNGMEIMLSRSNRAELKNSYQQFLFDLARRGKR